MRISVESIMRLGIQRRHTGVRFVVTFLVLLAVFYAVYWPLSQTAAYHFVLGLVAKLASGCTNLLGVPAEARGSTVFSGTFAIGIVPGCDGMEALALFGAAVLASPVPIMSRVLFLVAGSVALMVVNTIRIATILIIALKDEDMAQYLHWKIWPGVLIVSVLACWMLWARWSVAKLQRAGLIEKPKKKDSSAVESE